MFHPLRKKRLEIGLSGETKDFILGTCLSLRCVGCPGHWNPLTYNLVIESKKYIHIDTTRYDSRTIFRKIIILLLQYICILFYI